MAFHPKNGSQKIKIRCDQPLEQNSNCSAVHHLGDTFLNINVLITNKPDHFWPVNSRFQAESSTPTVFGTSAWGCRRSGYPGSIRRKVWNRNRGSGTWGWSGTFPVGSAWSGTTLWFGGGLRLTGGSLLSPATQADMRNAVGVGKKELCQAGWLFTLLRGTTTTNWN